MVRTSRNVGRKYTEKRQYKNQQQKWRYNGKKKRKKKATPPPRKIRPGTMNKRKKKYRKLESVVDS